MASTTSSQDIALFTRRWLRHLPAFFIHPVSVVKGYERGNFRGDLVASLTIAIMLLPQAIAYALIAELPPQTGLFAAVVAGIVGGLWGSSNHLHTGPTNTNSLIVLSGLLAVATPGTPEYILAAGVLAVWAGIVRLVMGLARLGMLVNFVSDSVVVGFTAGAGILIVVNQMRHIMRVDGVSTPAFFATMRNLVQQVGNIHPLSLEIGIACIVILVFISRFFPRVPGPLLILIGTTALVWIGGLHEAGVAVLGSIPRGLPPFQSLPLFDPDLLQELGPSIVAVALIGLIEAASISRAVAARSGQYLNNDQEFVGQGLANIAAGFFSGYPVAGSLTRSVVNYEAGARSQASAILSSTWVLVAMVLFAPAAAFLPRAALASILIVTGVKMVNYREALRIFRTSQGDSGVMVITFGATLLLPLEYAVLTGVLTSFARFIFTTSMPTVQAVLPKDDFKHFDYQPDKPVCPQLGVLSIMGSLYFGAAPYVEDSIRAHMEAYPEQRYLLLRMHRVNHCDISGIHMLETILRLYRQKGGDIFFVGLRNRVLDRMELSGFIELVGRENILSSDDAISHIFYRILSPAICVYQCSVRVWKECQSLPKSKKPIALPAEIDIAPTERVPSLLPQELWQLLNDPEEVRKLEIIDIREPSEYDQGHLRLAKSIPMARFFEGNEVEMPRDQDVILICRSGRRSHQLAYFYLLKGYSNVYNLEGGMMGLEIAALPKSGT